MTTPYEQIQQILNKDWIIDKTLSFWCNLLWIDWEIYAIDSETDLRKDYDNNNKIRFPWSRWDTDTTSLQEIIWHPWWYAEILRWFDKIEYLDVTIWWDWTLSIYNTYIDNDDWVDCDIIFDLTKPLQSQDLTPLLDIMESIINQK